MKLSSKASYLQGLIEGMQLDDDTKNGKALRVMVDIIKEMAEAIEDIQEQVYEITELCDTLDSDLGDVEELLICSEDKNNQIGKGKGNAGDYDFPLRYSDGDSDDYDDDPFGFGEVYEIICPSCGTAVVIDDDLLDNDSIDCPQCGELLEYDFSDAHFETGSENDESKKEKDED